ncbi:MAG: YggS family pyridoxal phosphate-dependent enzyme [Clostridia bacterium]
MISEIKLLENYQYCINEIKTACREANRNFDDLTILGASKTMPIERIQFLIANTNIKCVGENRVQELCEKYDKSIDWHFIGQLQTNKVKYIIDKVSLIHSVDRLSLAIEIDKQAKKIGKTQDVLIEVNIGREVAKGGVFLDEVENFAKSLENLDNIKIKGLMAVMPNVDFLALDNFYLQLRDVYDKLKETKVKNANICYLSAGMSNDYRFAVKYGANIIRLGRAIFGER